MPEYVNSETQVPKEADFPKYCLIYFSNYIRNIRYKAQAKDFNADCSNQTCILLEMDTEHLNLHHGLVYSDGCTMWNGYEMSRKIKKNEWYIVMSMLALNVTERLTENKLEVSGKILKGNSSG